MTTVSKLENKNSLVAVKREGSAKLATVNVPPKQKSENVPFRKLTILGNVLPDVGITNKDQNSQLSTEEKQDIYQQRKRMFLEYKELFAALMKLPDKDLQKKLLDVINNHHLIEHNTVGTQTDLIELKVPLPIQQDKKGKYDAANKATTPNIKGSENCANTDTTSISKEITKARKRKRKISLPQVNKESRAKQLTVMNKPKTANGKNISISSKAESRITVRSKCHANSFCISECGSDVNVYEDTETNYEKEIEQSNYLLENGLLPIQDAVVKNQTNKLNMHVRIWRSYKGVDLNYILTEEDEDLLQLAVLSTCDSSVINMLLKNGLNPNTLDFDSNTIVHLAILNDITIASLEHLMKHIDLKLLLTLNDDGYTALHLAVRQDRYLLAECLINIVDERLIRKRFYKRQLDDLEIDESAIKKHFKDYYEKVCLKIAADEGAGPCVIENHDLKQQLLQSRDGKSGNTALYFAIDNQFEHLIYFLLAHFTDPRTENLSGLNCKDYFWEFGRTLNLNLNIDNIMEKVIKLLS